VLGLGFSHPTCYGRGSASSADRLPDTEVMDSKLSGLGKTVRGYMQGREGASPTNREREPIPRPAIAPADSDVILDFLPRCRNRYGIALKSGGWPVFLVNGPSAARTRANSAQIDQVLSLPFESAQKNATSELGTTGRLDSHRATRVRGLQPFRGRRWRQVLATLPTNQATAVVW
jgi:hypothetical protein